jgi:hypothetical protein
MAYNYLYVVLYNKLKIYRKENIVEMAVNKKARRKGRL